MPRLPIWPPQGPVSAHIGDCSFLSCGPLGTGNLPYWVARFQRFLLVLWGSGGKLPGMKNHYHAIIAHTDGADPNQRVTLEAETVEKAVELFHARYGKEAVLKVWDDYFETQYRT